MLLKKAYSNEFYFSKIHTLVVFSVLTLFYLSIYTSPTYADTEDDQGSIPNECLRKMATPVPTSVFPSLKNPTLKPDSKNIDELFSKTKSLHKIIVEKAIPIAYKVAMYQLGVNDERNEGITKMVFINYLFVAYQAYPQLFDDYKAVTIANTIIDKLIAAHSSSYKRSVEQELEIIDSIIKIIGINTVDEMKQRIVQLHKRISSLSPKDSLIISILNDLKYIHDVTNSKIKKDYSRINSISQHIIPWLTVLADCVTYSRFIKNRAFKLNEDEKEIARDDLTEYLITRSPIMFMNLLNSLTEHEFKSLLKQNTFEPPLILLEETKKLPLKTIDISGNWGLLITTHELFIDYLRDKTSKELNNFDLNFNKIFDYFNSRKESIYMDFINKFKPDLDSSNLNLDKNINFIILIESIYACMGL